MEEHNLLQRAMELLHECYFDADKANKLDEQITAGMLAAEKACLITYRLPWDRVTHDLMTRINILKTVLSQFKTRIDSTAVIDLKMKELSEPIVLPTSLEATNKELRELKRKQRELTRDKRSYNTAVYEEREKAFIEAYKSTMSEKRAKAIFKAKEDTIKFMKLLPKSGRKQITSGPLSCILVPLPKEGIELEWHAITDGPTIKRLILARNKKHFSQAQETPLATNEIINLFGPGGDTEYAEQILNGTADLERATDDETSKLQIGRAHV